MYSRCSPTLKIHILLSKIAILLLHVIVQFLRAVCCEIEFLQIDTSQCQLKFVKNNEKKFCSYLFILHCNQFSLEENKNVYVLDNLLWFQLPCSYRYGQIIYQGLVQGIWWWAFFICHICHISVTIFSTYNTLSSKRNFLTINTRSIAEYTIIHALI